MSTPITPSSSGAEQRLTFRLLSYWTRIKGDRALPSLADVQISEIEEMWHFTFTLDVRGPESEHIFAYFGSELVTVFKVNYNGELVENAMQDTMIANTIGFYPKVIETRAPVSESSNFYKDGREIRYRSLILPLSSDGQTIDFLIGTANYKQV